MSEKHVRVLRRVRKAIESGDEMFVCNALNRAAYDRLAAQQITEQITLDLGGFGTLNSWISCKTREETWHIRDPKVAERMRLTRLAWIDAMIEYWRDKP